MSNSWIPSVNHWADAVMPNVLRATWQGGLFIAAVWVICKFFRSMPASGRNWLWLIASIQMLVRLVSVATLPLPILPATHQPAQLAYYAPSEASESSTKYITPLANTLPMEPVAMSILVPAAEKVSPTPLSVATLVMSGWLLGVCLCIAVSIGRLAATHRMLASATPIPDGLIIEIVQEFCDDYGMKQPRLLESSQALCPLLAGWLRPAIVLPYGITETLDESQLRMALAHEFAHLRRNDLWFGIVPAVTQCLFFFHPLAWLATHEAAATREAACDSEALRISGGSPAAFARLLLNTAQSRSSMAVLGTAFGYRLIQRRISMLKTLTASNTRRYRGASSFVLALAALCALPWSVTAQSATHSVPPTQAKKSLKTHKTSSKKHITAKGVGKKSTKLVASKAVNSGVPTLPTGTVATSRPVGVGIQAPTALAAEYVRMAPAGGFSGGVATVPAARPGHGRIGVGVPAAASGIPATGVGTFGRAMATTRPLGVGVGSRAGFGIGGGFASPPGQTQPAGGFAGGGQIGGTSPAQGIGGGGGVSGAIVSGSAPLAGEGSATASLIQRRDLSHPSKTEITDDGNSVELDRAELHAALVEIFKAKHCNFVIKSDVEPDVVTASLHGMSIEGILRTILGSVHQHLTFKRDEDGIFTVFPVEK